LLGSVYTWWGVFDQTGLLLLALLHVQDVFSLGCVIAELWLDGRAFFDLSRLLAYRRGEYDPNQALAGVAPDIAELIMHMIQRAPGAVWGVVACLIVFLHLLCWPQPGAGRSGATYR
jgi:hypothetical protein